MSKIKNVTVAGSGVLGFQIAFQTAIHGFETTVYDISDEVLERRKQSSRAWPKVIKRILAPPKNKLQKPGKDCTIHPIWHLP